MPVKDEAHKDADAVWLGKKSEVQKDAVQKDADAVWLGKKSDVHKEANAV